MTLFDTTFSCGPIPGELALQALDSAREVYGIRQIWFDVKAHSIRVEYDASRLTSNDVQALLRDAGIDV